MLRFCGSVLLWSSRQALSEDLNYINAAYDGYVEANTPQEDVAPGVTRDAQGKPIVLSTNVFDSQFGNEEIEVRRKPPKGHQPLGN